MKVVDVTSVDKKHKKEVEYPLTSNQFTDKYSVISNDLARQQVKFTLEDEKLLHCIFSQLDPYQKNEPKVRLIKADLFEKLGLTSTNRYMLMKKRIKELINKTMVDFIDENGSDNYGVVLINALSDYKSEYIDVFLNPNFMPYIEQLVGFYTKLSLDAIVSFDSRFSLILYKYLASWRSNHYERKISLTTKELKKIFGLEKNDYVSNGKFDRYNFEKKTIDVAIKEINEKVDWWSVSYEKIKKGNRIVGYEISWLERNRISTSNKNVSPEQYQKDLEEYYPEHFGRKTLFDYGEDK